MNRRTTQAVSFMRFSPFSITPFLQNPFGDFSLRVTIQSARYVLECTKIQIRLQEHYIRPCFFPILLSVKLWLWDEISEVLPDGGIVTYVNVGRT